MTCAEPLQPMYDFSVAPAPVSLYSGKAELRVGGQSDAGTGEVQLHFLPTPRIKIAGNFQQPSTALQSIAWVLSNEDASSFLLDGQKIEGWATDRKLHCVAPGALEVHWNPSSEPLCVIDDAQAKTTVATIFHLFNFIDFRGGGLNAIAAPAGRHQAVLQHAEWRVIIQSLGKTETADACKRIGVEGGSFLTHVGKLERVDGNSFSADDSQVQRLLLANFLSFVTGNKCWPVCGVGLDVDGGRAWETWCSPRSGRSVDSWFDQFKTCQIEILFPLFARRWTQSDEWRDCLRAVIYWYVQVNTDGRSTGIDAAIILAQAALERLAHHHLVVDRKMISHKGFDDLRVSDRMRLLFSSLGIPNVITATTPEIQKAAKGFKWADAPHALTDIRNELVHPISRKQVSACMLDGWRLSLWYLELSILAMCGYDGTYTNRLTAKYAGQSEDVPWKAKRGQE